MKTNAQLGKLLNSYRHIAVSAGSVILLIYLMGATAAAETYKVLWNAYGWPKAGLTLDDGMLYGATSGSYGGGNGKIFKMSTNGVLYFSKELETYCDWPLAGVIVSGSTVYGTAGGGFPPYNGVWWNRYGAVFKLDTNGNNYVVLRRFNGTDGAYPHGALARSGQTLYGTTYCGPVTTNGGQMYFGNGKLFKMNTDGSGFAVLKDFGGLYVGTHPIGGLVLSGTTLFGVTAGGGGYPPAGNVFRIETDGSGFAILASIDGYLIMNGDLLLSGSTLYGTTKASVFKVETDGSGFKVIKTFSGSDPIPASGLCLSGQTLYGTGGGGAAYLGTVFQLNTDGTGFAILKEFTGPDGARPCATLVMSGTTLYGTTEYGGEGDAGVVFSLTLDPPSIVSPVPSQTTETGTTVTWDVAATGTPLLHYQWFHGTEALGEFTTNSAIELTNLQASHIGEYTVVITNAAGALTSTPAMLNVIEPVTKRTVPALSVFGTSGAIVDVRCADLLAPRMEWLPVTNFILVSATRYCFDVTEPLPTSRFYRATQLGGPGAGLVLAPPRWVPAITLTGGAGDKIRLDGIEAIGPTNAWFTIETVTLTENSQLYFDLGSWGQPRRLYRLVPVP